MIHLDFETRSENNLVTDGSYKYAVDPSTDVNCFAFAIGDETPELWLRVHGDPLPPRLIEAVKKGMMIAAWNAAFERLIWNNVLTKYGAPKLPIEQFYCVAANARARGYPGKLEKAARFAGLAVEKDREGYLLMMKMCKPRRIEEDGTVVWWDDYKDHVRQGEYCKQDVVVERTLLSIIMPFNAQELSDYHLSEEINDRGIKVDRELAHAAVTSAATEKLTSDDAMKAMTGGAVTACTQVANIKAWVEEEWRPIPSLNKSDILDMLDCHDIPPHVADVLELRLENSKAAVSKFAAMLNKSDPAGIVRGLFVFHGAGPGRFTSFGLQVQNLVRESNTDAIPVLKKHGIKGLRMLGEPVEILSQMVRPAFLAEEGKTFLIGDFSQMQARVTAWLAGEEKLLQLFREGKDTYCAFGSIAYGRTITKADTDERFASKGCVLGLGFGGAEGALARTLKKPPARMVLPGDQLTHFVKTYRNTYTKIVNFWYRLRDATLMAMFSKGTIVPIGPVSYLYDGQHLWCRLPSGRLMCYPYARVVQDDYGDCIEYRRGNRSPKSGVIDWPVERLWYGTLTENLAQAIEFDLMMLTLRRMRKMRDLPVRIHVHDEIVPEVDKRVAEEKLAKFLALMKQGADWSEGLPIEAEGHISDRYVK
ncbi:MAG: hypothetical protein E6Q24_14630 [Chitinophagaceae bacterium]|nr:MAG: hypothetical protein E6Q24_14630 [Chitinophagaceae bacterium]